MNETRADESRLSFERGEIRVDFGHRSAPDETGQLEIELTKRIVMPPAAARRLLLALAGELRGRQTRPPAAPAPSEDLPLEALLDPTSRLDSSRAQPSASGRHAARVFTIVRGLGVTYGHERSFRMRRGELLSNRFLLTVDRASLGRDGDRAILEAWRQLDMPTEYVQAAERDLRGARTVHFGFEGHGDGCRLKAYLELAATLEAAEEAKPGDGPLPLHIAYKWDPESPGRRVISRYMLHPALTREDIGERIAAVYDPASESLELSRQVLAMAADRMPEEDIQYLEVEEEGNPRRSFDVNLYDAELRIRDLQAVLSRMRSRFEIPAGRFQALYDQIKSRRFGHLAGGVHRNGGEFFNVYHGGVFIKEGLWRAAATTAPVD